MRYETLTLGGNVIRFPVELRAKPSIDLLVDVAPDSREVELIAEAFGFDAPDPEGRAKADRAMADRIATMVLPVERQERRAALSAILKPLVGRAVAACAQARQASLRSDADNERSSLPRRRSRAAIGWAPLKEAADYWAVEAARLQIVAHEAAQTAHGAGRADRVRPGAAPARRPSNAQDDIDALIAAEKARSPNRAATLSSGERAGEARRLRKSDSCSRGSPRAVGVRRYPRSIGRRAR